MEIVLDFKINKADVKIEVNYDVVALKLRFKSILGNEDFFMDRKVFEAMIKNEGVLDFIKASLYEEVDKNSNKILSNFSKLKDTTGEENMDIFFRGQGFTIVLNIVDKSLNSIKRVINDFDYCSR